MKQIKLSGRERSVLRYIDWATGTKGTELLEFTRLEPEDLVDVLNGLMEVGYVEMVPYAERTSVETFRESTFEVNPGYALDLKTAMHRT
jgi:DNA-binding MarR family transcriptional regulator